MAAASIISKEDTSYIRLQSLVGKIGTKAVREYFDKNPNLGPTVLQGLLAREKGNLKRKVNVSQLGLLYPPGGTAPTSSKFDLTLLVLLLRNYGALGEPGNFKWGELPPLADIAIYHDIARLKYYRNKYAHATFGICDADFLVDWKELEGAILRMIPTTKKAQLTSEIKELLTAPLGQEDLVKHINVFQNEASSYSKEIKDKIRRLQSKTLKNTKRVVTKIESSKQEIKQEISKLKSHIDKKLDIQTKQLQNLETSCNISEQLGAFRRKLKRVYKEKFKKVQSVSSVGGLTMFDVTSRLYMDLDCTPLEIRCTHVRDRNSKHNRKQRQKRQREDQDCLPSAKKSRNESKIQMLKQIPNTSTQTEILKPPTQLSTSCINEAQSRKQALESNQLSTSTKGNAETEPMIDEHSFNIEEEHQHIQMSVNTEQDKPTTTAQISRLFTKDDNPDKLPILVEAEAGVGKTTFFHRLALDWANDSKDMEQFKLVFLIPLRRVRSKKKEDIICDDLQLLLPEHKQDLKRCLDLWDDQILFLIDGLDEVQLAPDNELTTLLKGTESESHVFCSSRPMLKEYTHRREPHGMENYLLVKLLGFSDQNLMKYINQYFRDNEGSDEDMSDTVMAECSKHFYCRALMKIPLYAGLFCFLWGKNNDSFPETATQLFNKFLLEILNNYLFRHSNPVDSCNNKLHLLKPEKVNFVQSPMVNTVPPELRCRLRCISKLAYTTLMEHKMIFTLEDADKCDLSLENLIHMGLFTVEEDDGSIIYFRHKLFHEYFAGLYLTLHGVQIYTLFNDSRDQIINRCHILQNAFFFAAGLCEDTYERIIFASKYSFHNSDGSASGKPCAKCQLEKSNCFSSFLNKSIFVENHKESCARCLEMGTKKRHEFDFEKTDECDNCYKMAKAMMFPESKEGRDTTLDTFESDLQELSFVVQLAFEHHTFDENKGSVSKLSRLPVHCSSAHSLAAAMYTLEMVEKRGSNKKRNRSIVLIDGPLIDIDQLLCILQECNKNEDIKFITLMEASQTLIEEILKMEWKYVEKLGFEDCQVVVPITKVTHSFPNVSVVLYDKSTWQSENMFTGKENKEVVSQEVTFIVKTFKEGTNDKGYLEEDIEEEEKKEEGMEIIERDVVEVEDGGEEEGGRGEEEGEKEEDGGEEEEEEEEEYDFYQYFSNDSEDIGNEYNSDYSVDIEEDEEIHVDSLTACKYLNPSFLATETSRVVTVWVEEYKEWQFEDREKCIPESLIKGICECGCLERYESCNAHHLLTGIVHKHGLQWKHHCVYTLSNTSYQIKGQEHVRIDFFIGMISLSERDINEDYIRETLEYSKKIVEITRLYLYKAGFKLCANLLKTKWPYLVEVRYIKCEVIVLVDDLAANFPQIKRVVYDEQTLNKGRPITEIQNPKRTVGMKVKFWLDLYEDTCDEYKVWPCTVCSMTDLDRKVRVDIPKTHKLGSSESSQWKNILSSPINVRRFCFHMVLLDPPFQHLEYVHFINTNCDIAKVCEQNPYLRKVALEGFKLDLSKNLQEQFLGFNEAMTNLKSYGKQWRVTSIVFGCDCSFICSETRIWPFCLQYVEIPCNKVQAWCCKNIDELEEQESFVLQHHLLHCAIKQREKVEDFCEISKKTLMSLHDINPDYVCRKLAKIEEESVELSVYKSLGQQQISIIFTKS